MISKEFSIVLLIASLAPIFCGCKRPEQITVEKFSSNLHPATGAFGWNLGDKLLKIGPIQTNTDNFSLSYDFTPDKPIPPFDLYYLDLTSDYTIYAIEASGHSAGFQDSNWRATKDALVQALTEKYGIREHMHYLSPIETDVFDFGTDERSVKLTILRNDYPFFNLTYSDSTLGYKAQVEDKQRKADAQNSLKEDLKKQGL